MGIAAGRRAEHDTPIRFELRRYGRIAGTIELCGQCFRELVTPLSPDPLTVL